MAWLVNRKECDQGRLRAACNAALVTLIVLGPLSGCKDPYDRYSDLSRDDYGKLTKTQKPSQTQKAPPPIPELQPILAAPSQPGGIEGRLVSIQVTDTVPLKDVLLELSRKAGVDIELDPNIQGGIIFSAHERPFPQVIERIAELAGLRYTLRDNVLRFEVDNMYHQSYRLDALNLIRTSKSSVGTSTNVFSAVGSGGGGGGGNSSTSSVEGASESDLWKELTSNIQQIMQNSDPRNRPNLSQSSSMSNLSSAAATAQAAPTQPVTSAPLPSTQPAAPAALGAAQAGGASGDATASPATAAATQAAAQNVAQQTQAAVNQATGTGAAPATAATTTAARTAAPAAAAAATTAPATQSYFSMNKQAGIVSVFGTGRQHKLVRDYLGKVRGAMSSQVLIEAKVVEVTLSDQFKSGINWRTLSSRNLNMAAPLGISTTNANGTTTTTLPTVSPPYTSFSTATQNVMTLGFLQHRIGLDTLVSLVKEFGTVRTLSSPRLTVMNNQTAVLKVAENEVYFRTDIQTTTNNGVSQTTYSSTMNTVPIGLVMTVQPSINIDREEVALGLRPTISRIARRVNDPAVDLSAAQAGVTVSSSVPVVEVREMDSVVTVPSGQVVIMGGLMQERMQKNETGVPGAGELPFLGHLFRAQADQMTVTELVIFLKATVVRGNDSVDPADKEVYAKFTRDPRPLGF
jgi:MSHA biogenesis protein MshL